MISSAPRQRGGAPRLSSARHACLPGSAVRLPCIVGRAFTPAGGGQPGRILTEQGAAPLSRLTPPAPLTGEPSGWQALYKASPARGCRVERRLRRRKRDGAGLTVAEHKRASARAVRCGYRKPDDGCAVRRRRRGALPLCAGDILQSLAEPCPASVGDDACIVPETLCSCKPQAAGEIARRGPCANPEGYWQGKAPHPSVG